MVEVILKPLLIHVIGRIQSHLPKDIFSCHTLMFEIVQGIANPRVGHPQIFIYVRQKNRYQSGLPIVAMDNFWVLVRLEHKLQRCSTKEGKALNVIIVSVKYATVEEVLERMRFNKETLNTIHKTEVYVTMKILVMVGNPQITIRFVETPNSVVTHAIVFRENNLHCIPPRFQFTGKPLNNVAQTTDLGNRCTFGSNHYDVHVFSHSVVKSVFFVRENIYVYTMF